MIFDLIATIIAGIAAAGIFLFLKRVVKIPLPRWVTPAVAGIGMLAFAIWSEYSWLQRDIASRPGDIRVVWQNENRAFWRPWTYVFPISDRYRAVDAASFTAPEGSPDLRIGMLILSQRWRGEAVQIRSAVDCQKRQWASAMDGAEFSSEGQVTTDTWYPLDPTDPLFIATCAEG